MSHGELRWLNLSVGKIVWSNRVALVKCRECGREISSEATSCPHCGVPSPAVILTPEPNQTAAATKQKRGLSGCGVFLLGIVGFVIVIGIATSGDKSGAPPGSPTTPAPAPQETASSPPPAEPKAKPPALPQLPEIGSWTTIAKGAFGCADIADTEKVSSLAAQGDQQAALSAIMDGIMAGKCVDFDQGDHVYVDDVSVWHGDTQVHKKGSPNDYWVYTDRVAVKPKADAD